MSKSLINHTNELIAILGECIDKSANDTNLNNRRLAAMQGAAVAKAITANMEVQSASLELLATKIWEDIDAAEVTNKKVAEMSEAEM